MSFGASSPASVIAFSPSTASTGSQHSISNQIANVWRTLSLLSTTRTARPNSSLLLILLILIQETAHRLFQTREINRLSEIIVTPGFQRGFLNAGVIVCRQGHDRHVGAGIAIVAYLRRRGQAVHQGQVQIH